MCIMALWAKTDKEYIKHLEKMLLDDDYYQRCEACKRVDYVDTLEVVGEYYACPGRCKRELQAEMGTASEDSYRSYKVEVYGRD
jgi:hypothetical protein